MTIIPNADQVRMQFRTDALDIIRAARDVRAAAKRILRLPERRRIQRLELKLIAEAQKARTTARQLANWSTHETTTNGVSTHDDV